MQAALFDHTDETFTATEHARGPWDPTACHGGPVAALMTRTIERVDDGPWQIARVTLELIRPVPVGKPMTVSTEIERPGRRVSLIAATLHVSGVEVARARALRIALNDLDLPADIPTGGPPPLSPPDDLPVTQMQFPDERGNLIAYHNGGCELRFAEGNPFDPGPVAVWIRLRVPVIAGEEPSGPQRAVAAADFGNGVSAAIPFEKFTFINPDLTVHLGRPPQGEWIGMRAESHYEPHGAGLAESALFDTAGRVGRSVQSLLVSRR